MLQPSQPRLARVVRLGVALVVLAVSASVGAAAGCGPYETVIWVCLSPVTGKLDSETFDRDHFVNGEPDPCHCYDPCGPATTCPIVVDAGPLDPGCDAGDGGP